MSDRTAAVTAELRLERAGDRVRLVSPEVGWFTCALPEGTVLVPGQAAGVLVALGRAITLVVPPGVAGAIATAAPERVRRPVGMDTVLYELRDAGALGAELAVAAPAAVTADGALVLRARQAGRFYHRPAPDEPAFVSPGDVVEPGRPIGMIEVMKTFGHVPYEARDGLPARAKVVRLVSGDASEVRAGDALLEVEPA